MKFSFRAISKFCYLIVIIGFLMPMAAYRGFAAFLGQMNGFQYANTILELVGGIGVLLYVFFAFAVIGLLIGVILLLKKNVPIFIDWIIHLIGIGGSVYFFVDPPEIILSGVYVIVVGVSIAVILQIISAVKKESI